MIGDCISVTGVLDLASWLQKAGLMAVRAIYYRRKAKHTLSNTAVDKGVKLAN